MHTIAGTAPHMSSALYAPPTEKDNGSWLCAEGPYLEYIKRLCDLEPTLRLPDIRNRAVPLGSRTARVTVLGVGVRDGERTSSPSRQDFRMPGDARALAAHFASQESLRTAARKPARNIYLVEGLNTETVALLGQGLSVGPAFFANHERTSNYLRLPYEPSLAPRLPSLQDASCGYSLNYYEVRAPMRPFEGYSVGCADSGRDVEISSLNDRWELPVVLSRRCSVWQTRYPSEDDWSVLILCDPPFRSAHVWHRASDNAPWQIKTVSVTSTPFQGGYADVAPWRYDPDAARASWGGPERQGLCGDLIYYMTERWRELPNGGMQTPRDASVYLKRIVASHYLHLIEYYGALLSSQEFSFLRKKDFSAMDVASLEGQWSDKQLTCTRLNRFIKDTSSIMLQLKIPFECPGSRSSGAGVPLTDSSTEDFQHVYMQLKILKERADFLHSSLTALTGIIGSRRSIREAKTVKGLTLVAMVFIPLAFTAGLLSMYDDFLPGADRFWMFFAIALPLVALVFGVTYLFDLGYDANGRWKVDKIRSHIRLWS